MKKRFGLVCALCALSGVFGMTGCGEDSKKDEVVDVAELKIVPSDPFDMNQGEGTAMEASYVANSVLEVSSNNIACIIPVKDKDSGDEIQEVNTGDANKASFGLFAAGENCHADIEVRAKDGGASKKVRVTVPANNTPKITVAKTLNLEVGEQKSVTAVYKDAKDQILANKSITISAQDANQDCVSFTQCNATDSNGECAFVVTAASAKVVTKSCTAVLNIKSEDNISAQVTVTVKNPAATESDVEVKDDWKLTVSYEGDEVSYTGNKSHDKTVSFEAADLDKGGVVEVKLTDGSNVGQKDKFVEFATSNSACATIKPVKTGTGGKVDAVVKLKKANCDTTFTATVSSNDKIKTNFDVHVDEVAFYNFRVALDYPDDAKRCANVEHAYVFASTKSCGEIERGGTKRFFTEWDHVEENIQSKWAVQDGEFDGFSVNKTACTKSDAYLVEGIKLKDFPVSADDARPKSIFAFVTQTEADGEERVLGHACEDREDELTIEHATEPLVLDIISEPYDIKGTYYLTANFDFTRGLEKSLSDEACKNNHTSYPDVNANICVPAVETMKAGDWVTFINNFAIDPVATLLEFVWVNSIDRLKDVDNEGIRKVMQIVLGAKAFALPIAYKAANDALMKFEWFKTYKQVSGDISELASNMQLGGKFQIDNYDGSKATVPANGAKTIFDTLQYRWSLAGDCKQPDIAPDEATVTCSDYYYNGNPNVTGQKCRQSLDLDLNDTSIEGIWTSESQISNPSSGDGQDANISISAHSVRFKWASILYGAVFGKILPLIFKYDTSTIAPENTAAVNDVRQKLYIRALLTRLLFQSVVSSYANYVEANQTKLDGLQISWKDQYTCQNFILALIEWILAANVVGNEGDSSSALDWLKGLEGQGGSSVASMASAVVKVLGNMVCNGDNGFKYNLAELDKLVIDQLNKVEFDSTNGLNISSESCPLYTQGTEKFQFFGHQDTGTIPTANDVFAKETYTQRCKWNVQLPPAEGQTSNLKFDGIFHATRVDKDDFGDIVDFCGND